MNCKNDISQQGQTCINEPEAVTIDDGSDGEMGVSRNWDLRQASAKCAGQAKAANSLAEGSVSSMIGWGQTTDCMDQHMVTEPGN